MESVLDPGNVVMRKNFEGTAPMFACSSTEGCTIREAVAYEGLGSLMAFIVRNELDNDDWDKGWQRLLLGGVFATEAVFRAVFLEELRWAPKGPPLEVDSTQRGNGEGGERME